jgi:hypothetical protein
MMIIIVIMMNIMLGSRYPHLPGSAPTRPL